MASPQRNAETFVKMDDSTAEHVDSIQNSLKKLLSLSPEETTEIEMLRSRMNEQSSLIGILKQRSDELLDRYQALQIINSELEDRVTDCQEELDGERKNREILEKRFMDLADNNKAIIVFMDEYKTQNAQLKMENKQLKEENSSLFCKKLQDKEGIIENLMQEIQELKDQYTKKENEYRETLAGYQAKHTEQATQHQALETSLLDQLHEARQEQRDAVETCKDLKLKLQNVEEQGALRETSMRESITNLTKEKDKLLALSMEREKTIQENQEEIQQLETKLKEEKSARAKAEHRFKQEAEAVNADIKVKCLQSALDESITKYEELKKDLEALKQHSTSLLKQERELNTKLRHLIG